MPGNRKLKFISNKDASTLQGAVNLPKKGGDLLCITKSLKDTMLLYELGVPAIAPNSENIFLSEEQLDKLKSKFSKIYVFFDNDLPGISAMAKISKQHPELKYLFIPRKYGAKDISDFYKKYGKDKTIQLINETKEYYGK